MALGVGLAIASTTSAAPPTDPLTLEAALAEARSANLTLPVPALDVQLAAARQVEAAAERRLHWTLEGELVISPPGGYDGALSTAGVDRLQIVGRRALVDGGALAAGVARAAAGARGAAARYRVAELDLDLEVRLAFAELEAAATALDARRRELDRLTSYRTFLAALAAAGQGVTADLLRTDVRLAADGAAIAEAEDRVEQARLALGDLVGREPGSALAIAPRATPAAAEPDPADPEATSAPPEIEAAAADAAGFAAELAAARAERRLHLDAQADVGLWGSDTWRRVPPDVAAAHADAGFGHRLDRDAGFSLGLVFSLPLFDRGAIRARELEAELALEQSRRQETVARRQALFARQRARIALASSARRIAALATAAPRARDAYLDAESRYRGGAATTLDVLSAHDDAVETEVGLADAIARYRAAEALAIRWGNP